MPRGGFNKMIRLIDRVPEHAVFDGRSDLHFFKLALFCPFGIYADVVFGISSVLFEEHLGNRTDLFFKKLPLRFVRRR